MNTPVEFGAKLDLSIDGKGYVWIETISFEAYNESTYLQEAIARYYDRPGRRLDTGLTYEEVEDLRIKS